LDNPIIAILADDRVIQQILKLRRGTMFFQIWQDCINPHMCGADMFGDHIKLSAAIHADSYVGFAENGETGARLHHFQYRKKGNAKSMCYMLCFM